MRFLIVLHDQNITSFMFGLSNGLFNQETFKIDFLVMKSLWEILHGCAAITNIF